ncbi:MAG TPA: hypothetical protein PKW79_02860 [Rhabdochlamydiaceae bacterium]|nr:hypothetical protein [Rhabdochlamydiaceae bacterium]
MADTASISKCLRDLQEFYGRKLPEGAILKWSQKLKFLDSRDLQVAVDDLISHERQFPTPDIVLKYADEARNHRAARERQRESISSGETPNKHNPELARDSREFIETLFRFARDCKDKFEFEISWTQSMAKKYPNLASEYRDREKEAIKRLYAWKAKHEGRTV